MDQEPFVSILMTAYNRELYIGEAIESVLKSEYLNFELLIVDDCSTDNTLQIAEKYATQDRRIKVFANENNLTQFPNRNKAASLAKGKYIKYVDSDDLIYPWSIKYCVEMMEKYPDAGMGILYLKEEISEEYLNPRDSIGMSFFKSTILNIGPIGTILRNDLFKNIGYYDSGYGVPSDMYFNLKMAYSYPIILLKKDFFFYRIHEGQELNNKYSYVCYNYKYLQDALQLPGFPLSSSQKKFLLLRAEYYYVKDFLIYLKKSKDFKKAIKAYSVSGMTFLKMLRGAANLSLVKMRIKKFEQGSINI